MRRALAAAVIALMPMLTAAQQPNPGASDAERLQEERDRAGNPAGKSKWEQEQEEREFKAADVPLPAYPKKEGLVEFSISNPGGKPPRGALVVGKLSHSGGSDDAPSALNNLLAVMEQKLQMQVDYERRLVAPSDPKLFTFPILFAHGRRSFSARPEKNDVGAREARRPTSKTGQNREVSNGQHIFRFAS